MGNYPWLADSWPTTNLVHSGKEAVNCCTANHNSAERYYNETGISNYLNQTEKYSIGGSTEGPIYSTIDATSEDLHGFTYAQHASTTPYASTSIMPYTSQSQGPPPPALSGEQQQPAPGEGHWITQPGPSSQYAQPDRCNGKPKQKPIGKAVKTPSLTWMDSLPPPPPISDFEQCDQDDLPSEHEEMDLGSDEEWCPPLPERTYLMEGCEDGHCLRNNASSPATSYSHQSTATLTPSPHEEPRVPHDLPRLNAPDSQQLARRRLPCSSVPAPPALSPSLTQSNPNLCGPGHLPPTDAGTLPCPGATHRNFNSLGAGQSEDSSAASTPVHCRSPADACTPPSQKSRVKKKSSKTTGYRRDLQGDLPPPPEPPPEEDRLQACAETSSLGTGALSSLERSEHCGSHQRKGSRQDDEIIPYGSKSGAYLSRNQMSSNCSTTGSSSSRGSTGSRGPGSSRKHTEEMR